MEYCLMLKRETWLRHSEEDNLELKPWAVFRQCLATKSRGAEAA